MMPNFSYLRVNSLEQAVEGLTSPETRVLAGGTDLLGCLRDRIFPADKLVSITRLDKLRGIEETADGGLRIGALTTLTELIDSPKLKERFPGLAQAAGEAASPQLRNQGTIGGNICQKPRCWYYRGEFHCLRKGGTLCYAFGGENQFHAIFGTDNKCCIVHPSDPSPALVAFEATVRVVGPKGTRLVPMEKFHVLPAENVEKETVLEQGEIVTEIVLPKPAAGTRSSYRKVRARRSWDFALAGVALAVAFKGDKVERARVVLSGAAPVPWRVKEVEEIVTGKKLDASTIAKAAAATVKNAQPLEHNAYKIPLFKAVMEEQLTAMAKG
ncbi:MAG: xanthine dehydrogenase family protein subunit M [Desulfomonile tiedjei]|nr:xanthine dehydrogenase family protein subunit M [Desulfomonile tiedjei]